MANGECEHHCPQQNTSVVLGVGDASLVSLVCSENTSSPPPPQCIHQNSPCVTFGKVLENSETRVLVEIWNPFQSYTGRKLGIEQQSL